MRQQADANSHAAASGRKHHPGRKHQEPIGSKRPYEEAGMETDYRSKNQKPVAVINQVGIEWSCSQAIIYGCKEWRH